MFYAFEVYEKQLFPYYEQVRALNQAKEVFIVEDNVGVHHKARELMRLLREGQVAPFLKKHKISWQDCKVDDGRLYVNGLLYIPDNEELRTDIIKQYHNRPAAGRPGTARTVKKRRCDSGGFTRSRVDKDVHNDRDKDVIGVGCYIFPGSLAWRPSFCCQQHTIRRQSWSLIRTPRIHTNAPLADQQNCASTTSCCRRNFFWIVVNES